MPAYYNEIDPFAAAWLRELVKAGHIADGVVDDRSIEDVTPDDLRDFEQCHFFAGIGVWSHALRGAGWPDDRPIWTGSCPCQPFSAAGKGGGFDDERHLWPAWHWLIEQCRPPVLIGEQVAYKDAEPWLDLVQADLEALGYAFGAVAFPSAGIGAPHIRDRTYWVADTLSAGRTEGWAGAGHRSATGSGGTGERLADDDDARLEGRRQSGRERSVECPAGAGGMAGGLADTHQPRRSTDAQRTFHNAEHHAEPCGGVGEGQPGPVNGLWRAADWLFCRDGKWRPVEPGTFPLAHGAAARVGRLRGYGNAINAQAAETFIRAYLDAA